MTIMYGISNCDTIRKARRWLATHNVDYIFHDVRKQGVEIDQLKTWAAEVGWEKLLNRRGMTWRKLPDEVKQDLDEQRVIQLMQAHPAMIKRPVLEHNGNLVVGFSDADYAELFQTKA